MKKNKINIFYLLVLSTIAFMQLSLISCSEDNKEGYGTPEITGVRVPDPVYADSLFTKSSTGQLIAITGTNLSNVLKIQINDQQVSFNSTMNTDHSVMCTIPKEENGFKLTDLFEVTSKYPFERSFEYFGEKFYLPWGGYFESLDLLDVIELNFESKNK